MKDIDPSKFEYSPAEISKLFGKTSSWVYLQIQDKAIKAYRSGRTYTITRRDLASYIGGEDNLMKQFEVYKLKQEMRLNQCAGRS